MICSGWDVQHLTCVLRPPAWCGYWRTPASHRLQEAVGAAKFDPKVPTGRESCVMHNGHVDVEGCSPRHLSGRGSWASVSGIEVALSLIDERASDAGDQEIDEAEWCKEDQRKRP
jgi:hypothetical protein